MTDLHLCSQRFKTLQMKVYGTASDIAAAGKGNFRSLIFTQQGSQKIIRRSDLFDIFIIDTAVTDHRSIDCSFMTVQSVHLRADSGNGLQKYIDILNIRQVIDHHGLIRHDRCCQDAKRRVFRSADLYLAN